MNRLTRLLTIAAASACSLSALADLAHAQGQPAQPGNAGGNAGRGNRGGGGSQPGDQGGGQRRGGGGGGGMFGGGRGMGDTVSSEEMDRYADMLKLTKSQKDTVKTLHDAYQQDLENQQQKFRDQMQALRDDARDDPDARKEMADLFTKFRADRQKLETSFFNDVKATLTPEQQAQWPAVERTHRRETSMGRGVMSGERVDLVKIVDGLKLSADARKPIDPILEQYQIDLDRELIPRNEVQEKVQTSMREMFQNGGPQNADPSKMQKLIEDGRAAANKVREVNKRYARQVEQALTDEAAKAKFTEEVKRESFPQIYRPSYASRVAEAAGAIDGLTAEQKASIQEIKDRYTRESTSLNQKMETAYEQREQSITAQDIMGRFGGGGGGGGGGRGGFNMVDSPELQTLRDQRKELDDSTVEKIQNLLNEDQKAKLPQRGRGGDGGPGGGMGGGGQGGGGRGGNGAGRGGDGGDGANPPRNRNRGNNQPAAPSGRT